MFDKLRKHHLGFIIPVEDKERIEQKAGKSFVYDETQQIHVLFVYEEDLKTYVEYICQEGRVAKQKCGFAHICYQVDDKAELEKVLKYITENKLGYPLTELEESGSEECGFVIFYFIKNVGVIELNLKSE